MCEPSYQLKLAHLYAAQMNVYGDRGNVIALRQRCLWRGIDLSVTAIEPGDQPDWASFDLAFFGGGQDSGQALIAQDLLERQGPGLRAALEDGLVLLAICGGYQLLGHYFLTHTGERLPGLGVLDVHTIGGNQRLIGNIVVEADLPTVGPVRLVGFENHSGRTYHGPGVQSMGRVLAGHGDNGEDGRGGAIYRNTFGCYLHGSLLPKNPQLTDHLISLALRRRYGPAAQLAPLDATLELHAQQTMIQRLI
ncbi:CobB/CobQ domain protein glutamine amidotransferase [Oscillochloris trichoides DG-6]|uniref:Lipid II isoglutaminyl synthase (glutamine-hydrolyzing) subunit GatD n=1 Tax=Oscillochloris trichoides DG-6 TaxID=765420 RepID=E1IGM6_9CHLR|nr:glutamine amidotransferase [Oscillochloris trichoides]EFO79661.1 CobB/CobQ domain protein glutamine amidotransferase [Oscillochloris trichoides DG-6]